MKTIQFIQKSALLVLTIGFTACLKLDANLYNKKKLDAYQLDNYTGEQDFILSQDYAIPGSLIHQFTLQSKSKNESKATTIHAIYIGNLTTIANDTIIVYCHGNKWHMDFYWQRAKLLAHVNGKNKYGVLMMDYRGYGLSEGEPSEEGMYADVDACFQWLKQNGAKDNQVMIYGFSMGSAPSCELTANVSSLSPSKLILEAPFASSAVMAQDGSQLSMSASYFTDLKIDNAEEIKKIKIPFLWLHGTNDNFLNYKTHGQVVYNNYQGIYKTHVLIKDADHSEVPSKMGFDAYLRTLKEFITKK
ncbi:MAG: alpha/beta hydrolase [Bacteroidetes bacterium]|nr:alpha/beta hydrolase [Bacteroidota bacterium]MCA6443670.1 alpha/beta hydrolase [Bacteroidota bacterium]